MNTESLEKTLWTEENFEQMSWHDSKIYAMSFGIEKYELLFDIDYILEWISPKENETYFNFIIAPVTLIFRNVYDLHLDSFSLDIVIDGIYRNNPTRPKNAACIGEEYEYDWTIEIVGGEISFKSVGYKQYVRQTPKLLSSQAIGLTQRGGISFDTSLQL